MTAKDHNRLIGIFHLIQGGLQSFSGIMLGLIYGFLGVMMKANAHGRQEEFMGNMFLALALIVAPIILIFAGINLTAGYKMFKEKPGSRMWGIVASILCLPGVPLGTALGVYGLWFLFSEDGKNFENNLGNPNYMNQGNQNYINEGYQDYVGDMNQNRDVNAPPPAYKWK